MERNLGSPDRAEEPSPAIVRTAAEWMAHIESGDASESDLDALESWRAAHPAHATALDRLRGVRERFDQAPTPERETLRRLSRRPRRAAAASLFAVAVVVAGGFVATRLPVVQLYFADEQTKAGETRVVTLADGSALTLSSQTAVDLAVDADRRRVRLLRGGLLARVAKGRPAPFLVETADGTATALGTAFTVQKDAGSTTVEVAESTVRVCPARGQPVHCAVLTEGQRARISKDAVERLADLPPADVGGWAEGWLSATDRPLVDVLAEINRWRPVPVGFDEASLAGLRVSGVFALKDSDRVLANLAGLLPIEIDRTDPSAPVVRRR